MDQQLIINVDQILYLIGIISASSFVIVAIGDFVVAALQKIAENSVNKWDDQASQTVAKWWLITKDLWEQLRGLADRLSVFSRPKKM